MKAWTIEMLHVRDNPNGRDDYDWIIDLEYDQTKFYADQAAAESQCAVYNAADKQHQEIVEQAKYQDAAEAWERDRAENEAIVAAGLPGRRGWGLRPVLASYQKDFEPQYRVAEIEIIEAPQQQGESTESGPVVSFPVADAQYLAERLRQQFDYLHYLSLAFGPSVITVDALTTECKELRRLMDIVEAAERGAH